MPPWNVNFFRVGVDNHLSSKHLTDHISGFPASLWWLQPPNFYRYLSNWIISTCKGETSKKITTFVNAYFNTSLSTKHGTLSLVTQPKQFHPNAAEGHSSSSLPGRRPAPDLRNHIRGKGCKSPPEPCNGATATHLGT